MSREAVKQKAKAKKMESMAKKAKKKKLIIAGVCIAVVTAAAVLTILIFPTHKQTEAEIYSYHGQSVQLLPDGSFNARLSHNVRKNGTYTKINESSRIIVQFNIDGRVETGFIINNSLHIPAEWDDGHGHGNIFPRSNRVSSGSQHNHNH